MSLEPIEFVRLRELMRQDSNEELWLNYQFEQRLNGAHAPSNHFIRQELLRRIAEASR